MEIKVEFDDELLSNAESAKYRIEIALLKIKYQRLLSLAALAASSILLMVLLSLLIHSTFEGGRFELYLPTVTLLVGFVFIQSLRCFRISCFLYSSAILSRQRIAASIDEWQTVCSAENQL